jgi:queuine/archaeosine tRNA-ribosyltransferase
LKQCFDHEKSDKRPEERAMKCTVCANLERVYLTRLSEYVEARSSAGYRVSTRLAAQINVEMERARYELEEHQAVCLSTVLPPAHLPVREAPAELVSIAA